METLEELDGLKETLHNLMLLKIGHDAGAQVRSIPTFQMYTVDYSWLIFNKILNDLFTIVENGSPYSGEDDIEYKQYWLKKANCSFDNDELDTMEILVILDDRIQSTPRHYGTISSFGDEWYSGFAEVEVIENGIVVIWDETDGLLNYVDLLSTVTSILPNKEDVS